MPVWSKIAGDECSLVVVDEHPPLQLIDREHPMINVEAQTPSTPMEGKVEELEPTTRLVDRREDYWGVITARSLVSNDGFQVQSGIGGYLIRGGQVRLGVRIVHTKKSCDFKEYLNMLRGLCLLTKARGIMDELPWHLAVASRARNGLDMLMP